MQGSSQGAPRSDADADIESTTVTDHVAKGGLVYQRRGTGQPLVLIHGLGSRKEVWNPIIDALAAEREVIAVDLPGFGDSPLDGPCTVQALVDRMQNLFVELGLDRPELAGNSMGAAIALELGNRGLTRRVTAFSPIGFWRTPGQLWCQQATRTLRLGATRVPRQMVWVLTHRPGNQLARLMYGQPAITPHEQLRTDIDGVRRATGFEQAVASFSGYRFTRTEQLQHIPVTIAWGSRDALLTYRTQSRRAATALPTADHVRLHAAGHVPFSDDPVACVDQLLRRTRTLPTHME